MRNKNGYTLVEVLLVIVILSIVLIILIPLIISVVSKSKKQVFVETVNSYLDKVEDKYKKDSSVNTIPKEGVYVYNIQTDLNVANDKYQGYILLDARDTDNIKYYIFINNNEYQINNYCVGRTCVSEGSRPTIYSSDKYDAAKWTIKSELNACSLIVGNDTTCKNKQGYNLAQ